jgi:hypothetical protein
MQKALCLSLFLVLAPLAACGDDDGGTNNNHTIYNDSSVGQDGNVQQDANVQHDSAVQNDAATQHDAAVGPDSAVANGVVGDPCTDTNQCGGVGGGLTAECITVLFTILTFPGGYCTAACTPGTPDPCAASGGVCYDPGMGSGYCLKSCTDSSQCREAETYTCSNPLGGADLYCLPPIGMP